MLVICLFWDLTKLSEAVFEAGTSLTKKAEQERKRLQNVYAPHCTSIELCLTKWQGQAVSGSWKWRERECYLCKSKCERVSSWKTRVNIDNPCQVAPNARDQIKGVDIVVSTNHVTFLTNRFPRLISLLTSTIFVSGTSGITAILKYRTVNPIVSTYGSQKLVSFVTSKSKPVTSWSLASFCKFFSSRWLKRRREISFLQSLFEHFAAAWVTSHYSI